MKTTGSPAPVAAVGQADGVLLIEVIQAAGLDQELSAAMPVPRRKAVPKARRTFRRRVWGLAGAPDAGASTADPLIIDVDAALDRTGVASRPGRRGPVRIDGPDPPPRGWKNSCAAALLLGRLHPAPRHRRAVRQGPRDGMAPAYNPEDEIRQKARWPRSPRYAGSPHPPHNLLRRRPSPEP